MIIRPRLLLPLLALVGLLGPAEPPRADAAPRKVRVALCQIFAIDGDREGNFVRIGNAAAEAKRRGADIACFPESCLLGWTNPDAYQRACPIPGDDLNRLAALARKNRLHLCVGMDEKEGAGLYDSVVLIDDQGRLLLKHRKMENLDNDHLMSPNYLAGRDIRTVETRFGRIGLLICADTFRDDLLRRMAALKPDLVLVPYGWVGAENDWPKHGDNLCHVVSHAASVIGAPVVGTDGVGQVTHGPWAGRMYGGASNVADRKGRTVARAADRDRDVLVVTLTPGR